MKALSVRAPWWWAILHGKPIENRDWYTNQRGRIYLHAGKWWNQREVEIDCNEVEMMACEDGITLPSPNWFDIRMSGGCLVGTVEIIDCVTRHPSAFFVGKYGFVLRNPVTLPRAIPFKGALGFFDVPDEVLL
jgi:hypothetical protein